MDVKQTKWVDFGQRSGLKVHPVSIGAMRFPQDDDEAVALIRQAIDAGMIYIDTCRGYADSEIKVGKALKDGYREKVILSTKWAPWIVKIEETDDTSADCAYKRICESMERLDVDCLDFYQIWNITAPQWYEAATAPGGMLDGILRAKEEGLVKHIGFTTHDSPENIRRYIDEADWCEAILFTYNAINQTYKETVAYAHAKGIATIVMNPVGGGMFTEDSPVLRKVIGSDNVVETAHRYLAGDPNVDTVLCGINKPSDIVETIANYAKPPLSPEEIQALDERAREFSKESLGFCTDCKYCMPCPQGLQIPGMMHAVYLHRILKCPKAGAHHYGWFASIDKNTAAADCIQCGACEEKCTQKLNIIEQMEYAAEHLDPTLPRE